MTLRNGKEWIHFIGYETEYNSHDTSLWVMGSGPEPRLLSPWIYYVLKRWKLPTTGAPKWKAKKFNIKASGNALCSENLETQETNTYFAELRQSWDFVRF